MKNYTQFLMVILGLLAITINAQETKTCAQCNMFIKDKLHIAVAKHKEKVLQFAAIECLVNYLKLKDENSFNSIKVADYNSGNLIDATSAIYLKSEAIPSPMGANISAFKDKKTAENVKLKKGGEVFNWTTLKEKFEDSKFGAVHHNHSRPDAHAPIGVMGDHLHTKGNFMISVRYMSMLMDGNKSGTKNIEDTAIYNTYMVAPQEMQMDMIMLGVMYAPSNNVTLLLMQNFIKNNMELTARMMMNGMPMLRDFSTETSGIGDVKLGALINVFNNHQSSFHLNSGINIPIGSINYKDDTPMMNNAKLPYAMQLGSGTFDVTVGGTYKENYEKSSIGLQFLSTIRTGKNSEEYRFGNLHQLNFWAAYTFTPTVSFSVRLLGTVQDKISGKDSELNPFMVITADTNNYGGNLISGFLGLNIAFAKESIFKNVKLGIEAGAPIYEDYNGIQMNQNLSVHLGAKYSL